MGLDRTKYIVIMKLQIISLKGIEFEGEIISVNLKTTSGEITVLDNHRPIVTALAPGKLSVIKKGGDRVIFNINSGFLELDKNSRATILTG